jgi:hypothetical protein
MKRLFQSAALVLLVLPLALPPAAAALDLATRSVGPARTWTASDLARYSADCVHVKFVEGSDVTLRDGRLAGAPGVDLAPVAAALARADVRSLAPTFAVDRARARGWKARGEAESGRHGPDLSLWFTLHIGGGPAAVAALVNELNAAAAVEIAHPEAIPELAAASAPGRARAAGNPLTPDFSLQQGYLYNPPVGLNAPAAWAYAGGNGAGGKFIDVELCWTEDHEDFPFARLFYVGGATQDPTYETHGTAVLGEVIGQHNGYGVNGFAPGIDGYGVVAVTVAEWPTVPHYFQEAVDHLAAGDVWLIELQMYPPGRQATPMEYLQVNYDVIWTGVWARDVVCIEAGANGGQNLDDPSWGGIFDRSVRDSGAIMVAAGTPSGLVAESFTNYGSRMDVHAWGSSIVTTGYGDLYNGGTLQTRYTAGFNGTSGASPMVAGSALCLEGIARAAFGSPLKPVQVRSALHDTGTPQQGARLIGPRPNLGAAAARILETAAAPEAAAAIAGPGAIALAPNPFTAAVRLAFTPPAGETARVVVYDVAGRMVRVLAPAGIGGERQELVWDGSDARGAELGRGVYFLAIEAPGFERTIKVQKAR